MAMSGSFMIMRATESVMKRGMLRLFNRVEATNVVWIGQMIAESGKSAIPVLWKPSDGERDDRPGINGYFYKREVVAYEIAKLLEVDVPETIVYKHEQVLGSVQRWLENAVIGDYINMDYLIFMNMEQWRNAAAFDFVIGNNDRHSGNWMLDPVGKLWLIDNSSSFPEVNDCWRGSLAILRPMINRKIEVSTMFKDRLALETQKIVDMVRGIGLVASISSMEDRIASLLKVKRFSDLVITR